MTRILVCIAMVCILLGNVGCAGMFREGDYSATDENMPGAPDITHNHDSPNRI